MTKLCCSVSIAAVVFSANSNFCGGNHKKHKQWDSGFVMMLFMHGVALPFPFLRPLQQLSFYGQPYQAKVVYLQGTFLSDE